MSVAVDAGVIVRLLVTDQAAARQCGAAKDLLNSAVASGDPLLVSLCTLLEVERILRCHYRVDRAAMKTAIIAMLETPVLEFEHQPTVEEALFLFEQDAEADFALCLQAARSTHLGRSRFLTFDTVAAALPRGELIA